MKGNKLFDVTISGDVSTNAGRESKSWRNNLETSFSTLSFSKIGGDKIAVEVEFWIANNRFDVFGRNDLDNLIKPVLDAMKRMKIIYDDASVHHLSITKHSTQGIEGLEMTVTEWL